MLILVVLPCVSLEAEAQSAAADGMLRQEFIEHAFAAER